MLPTMVITHLIEINEVRAAAGEALVFDEAAGPATLQASKSSTSRMSIVSRSIDCRKAQKPDFRLGFSSLASAPSSNSLRPMVSFGV